jgi:hypothetical protein
MIKRFIKKLFGLYDDRDVMFFSNYLLSKERKNFVTNHYEESDTKDALRLINDLDFYIFSMIYKITNTDQHIDLENKISEIQTKIHNTNTEDEDEIQRLKVLRNRLKRQNKIYLNINND